MTLYILYIKDILTYASTENNDIKPVMILIEHIH